MIDLSKFIDVSYWVSPRASEFYWFLPITIVFSSLILLAIIINFIVKKKIVDKLKLKFLKSIPKGLLMFGLAGLVFVFFRYQQIRFLSMRLWFLLLLLGFFAWIAFYIFEFRVLYPKVECEYRQKQFEDKYKPKKGEKKRKNRKGGK